MLWMAAELKKDNPELEIVLTDLYPNLPAFERISKLHPGISFESRSIDARKVLSHSESLRDSGWEQRFTRSIYLANSSSVSSEVDSDRPYITLTINFSI